MMRTFLFGKFSMVLSLSCLTILTASLDTDLDTLSIQEVHTVQDDVLKDSSIISDPPNDSQPKPSASNSLPDPSTEPSEPSKPTQDPDQIVHESFVEGALSPTPPSRERAESEGEEPSGSEPPKSEPLGGLTASKAQHSSHPLQSTTSNPSTPLEPTSTPSKPSSDASVPSTASPSEASVGTGSSGGLASGTSKPSKPKQSIAPLNEWKEAVLSKHAPKGSSVTSSSSTAASTTNPPTSTSTGSPGPHSSDKEPPSSSSGNGQGITTDAERGDKLSKPSDSKPSSSDSAPSELAKTKVDVGGTEKKEFDTSSNGSDADQSGSGDAGAQGRVKDSNQETPASTPSSPPDTFTTISATADNAGVANKDVASGINDGSENGSELPLKSEPVSSPPPGDDSQGDKALDQDEGRQSAPSSSPALTTTSSPPIAAKDESAPATASTSPTTPGKETRVDLDKGSYGFSDKEASIDPSPVVGNDDDDLPKAVEASPPSQSGSSSLSSIATAPGSSNETPPDNSGTRMNYASSECGAKVLASNPEATGTSAVLTSSREHYMLEPCDAETRFLVIELCDTIHVDTFIMANYEFFSSTFQDIQLLGSGNYPTESWELLGYFRNENTRTSQLFKVTPTTAIEQAGGENGLDIPFVRYIKLRFLTHHGSQYYCPVSELKIHGTTELQVFSAALDHTSDISAQIERSLNAEAEQADNEPLPTEPVSASGSGGNNSTSASTDDGRTVDDGSKSATTDLGGGKASSMGDSASKSDPSRVADTGGSSATSDQSTGSPDSSSNGGTGSRTGSGGPSAKSDADPSSENGGSSGSAPKSTLLKTLEEEEKEREKEKEKIVPPPVPSGKSGGEDSIFKKLTMRIVDLEVNQSLANKYMDELNAQYAQEMNDLEESISATDARIAELTDSILAVVASRVAEHNADISAAMQKMQDTYEAQLEAARDTLLDLASTAAQTCWKAANSVEFSQEELGGAMANVFADVLTKLANQKASAQVQQATVQQHISTLTLGAFLMVGGMLGALAMSCAMLAFGKSSSLRPRSSSVSPTAAAAAVAVVESNQAIAAAAQAQAAAKAHAQAQVRAAHMAQLSPARSSKSLSQTKSPARARSGSPAPAPAPAPASASSGQASSSSGAPPSAPGRSSNVPTSPARLVNANSNGNSGSGGGGGKQSNKGKGSPMKRGRGRGKGHIRRRSTGSLMSPPAPGKKADQGGAAGVGAGEDGWKVVASGTPKTATRKPSASSGVPGSVASGQQGGNKGKLFRSNSFWALTELPPQ